VKWSPQQAQALDAVADWMRDKNAPQVFRLFGWAGTGKTTLAKHFVDASGVGALYGAFTGKAALVLRKKGCHGASTLHSLIYKVNEDQDTGKVTYELNPDSALSATSLLVVDEVSMVDETLGLDALSYGCRVLVLGDPFQLPPVGGAGFFTAEQPDFMLTEIHRQASDNPIIRMSMDVREGRGLKVGQYGDSAVLRRADVGQDAMRGLVMDADQIICGRNQTRRTFNTRMRQLHGIKSHSPTPGEKLICLKNNRKKGLLNGGMWTVRSANRPTPLGIVRMKVGSMDEADMQDIDVETPIEFFEGTEDKLGWQEKKRIDEFTFGYAITCHKSQGSQWDDVVVFDESAAFRDDAPRWLYTAVTRAAEKVQVVV
jgi:exodeoxyribonuclease-5